MEIYISHSNSFDYIEELYKPLKESSIGLTHTLTLPHEKEGVFVNSKEIIRTTDVVLAEVSWAATGLGIEIGWADAFGKRIIFMCRQGQKPSKSLMAVDNAETVVYVDVNDLIEKLSVLLAD